MEFLDSIHSFQVTFKEAKAQVSRVCLKESPRRLRPRLQETDYWCWAAVGSILRRFYCGRKIEQRMVAKLEVGCSCGTTGCACLQARNLESVLMKLGHDGGHDADLPTQEVVKEEFDQGRPICLRKSNGASLGGHFVILKCVTKKFFEVIDPWLGSHKDYPRRVRASLGGGAVRVWTDHYLTKKGDCNSNGDIQ